MRTLVALALLGASGLHGVFADDDKVRYHGDVRFRLEQDQDSRRADGTERDDRLRARIRLRFGVDVTMSERTAFGFRARSGSDASQQSPHVTVKDFDDGDAGDADVNLDKWFVRSRTNNGKRSGWVGRNSFPFWKQNELFWDDDVTLVGLAGESRHEMEAGGTFSIRAGYFALPVGMREYSGTLGAAQLVYSRSAGPTGFTAALGYYDVDADPFDPDATLLLAGDGSRDYGIVVASVQATLEAGGRPLRLGTDAMSNRDASDESDGHVLSARYGSTKAKGDWLVGYWYAEIERLAVVGSYAEDDWLRWGSATQTRSSDFEGHELRFAYAVSARMNLVARAYAVESISTVEDGKRFRVDLNYKLK